MAQCLYCQQDNPPQEQNCQRCGMALPRQQEQKAAQKLQRFKWFVLLLTIFCLVMIFWLPRTVPA